MNNQKRVNHPDYGSGRVIEDEENLCKEGEVLVKFDKSWYAGWISSSKYARLGLVNIEIVYQKDLIK